VYIVPVSLVAIVRTEKAECVQSFVLKTITKFHAQYSSRREHTLHLDWCRRHSQKVLVCLLKTAASLTATFEDRHLRLELYTGLPADRPTRTGHQCASVLQCVMSDYRWLRRVTDQCSVTAAAVSAIHLTPLALWQHPAVTHQSSAEMAALEQAAMTLNDSNAVSCTIPVFDGN